MVHTIYHNYIHIFPYKYVSLMFITIKRNYIRLRLSILHFSLSPAHKFFIYDFGRKFLRIHRESNPSTIKPLNSERPWRQIFLNRNCTITTYIAHFTFLNFYYNFYSLSLLFAAAADNLFTIFCTQ